jgi:hypothetical protein
MGMSETTVEERFSRHETSRTSWEIRDSSGTVVATAARRGLDISTNRGAYRLGGGWRPGTPARNTRDGSTAFTVSMGYPVFGKRIVSSDGTAYTLRYSGRGAEKMVMDVIDAHNVTVMTLKWATSVDPRRHRFPVGEAMLTGGLDIHGDIMLLMTLAFHVFQVHLTPRFNT